MKHDAQHDQVLSYEGRPLLRPEEEEVVDRGLGFDNGSNGPDALEQSGIVRGDIRAGFGEATGTAEGVPRTLELNVFGDDSGARRLGTVTGGVSEGWTVTLAVGVDATTAPAAGQTAGAPPGAPARG